MKSSHKKFSQTRSRGFRSGAQRGQANKQERKCAIGLSLSNFLTVGIGFNHTVPSRLLPRYTFRSEFDQYGDAMSAYRWRNGGYCFPPSPATPADPRFHGFPNYPPYNNPSYFHATQQHHANLIASQTRNSGFYSPQNSLYWASQYNHWTGPVRPLTPSPSWQVHPAILRENFTFQAPNYLSTPFVDQISHTKPSKSNPTVQMQQNPSSTSKKVAASESKQAPNDTACTPATPVAVTPHANTFSFQAPNYFSTPFVDQISCTKPSKSSKVAASESKQAPDETARTPATPVAVTPHASKRIQWPTPDIELVVKDVSKPVNETREYKRKRKNRKNRKEKVKKEPPLKRMHYYKKHMVRDPWFNIKPVVGIIVKKWAVDSVIEKTKGKCEGGLKIECSTMSLADCLEISFEETINGHSNVTLDQTGVFG